MTFTPNGEEVVAGGQSGHVKVFNVKGTTIFFSWLAIFLNMDFMLRIILILCCTYTALKGGKLGEI